MDQAKTQKHSRRSLFAGAATVGAVAAVSSVLPKMVSSPSPAAQPSALPKPERGGGYSFSEHVQRYYRTTRI